MSILIWPFQNERRLRTVLAGLVGSFLVLGILLGMVRAHGMTTAQHRPSAVPTMASTALVPPSTLAIWPSPTPDYGDADPIALEAVQAWLLHDLNQFTQIAEPAAVEEFASARPAPSGGQVTGDVVTLHGGPTEEVLNVPTSLGTMTLAMHVVDGAWLVSGMKYAR